MSAPPALPDIATLTTAFEHLYAIKYYFVACGVVLFLDIGLTFDLEVEYIWSRKWGLFTILWVCLRYIPPLMEIVVIDALFDPSWTPQVCARFLAFPGSYSLVCVGLVQCVFALRMYALYGGRRSVLLAFLLFFIGEVAFMAVFINHTTLLPDPPGVVGCAGGGSFGSRGAVAFWGPAFIFDVVVFAMTIYKSYKTLQGSKSLGLLGVVLRDGSIYFVIVAIISVVNMMTMIFAPLDLLSVNASLATTLPVILTNRLVLNLRASDVDHETADSLPPSQSVGSSMTFQRNSTVESSNTWAFGSVIDVLGGTIAKKAHAFEFELESSMSFNPRGSSDS
ncbi:hypothetical protein FB45DRAFT_1018040 [Roridomyces roridus]|uniref:DUF6533 domain-containing protein n=1 Tax=Roridomyces roridus TaxID=1738132 RepID=A0AAD7CJT7_9AGAR|nr:hypothetical protein FB45DRAFT_1018040 [Roridomyces roridus]